MKKGNTKKMLNNPDKTMILKNNHTLTRTIIAILILLIAMTNVFAQNANTQLSNLDATTAVNSTLLPFSTNTINIGSPSKKWKDIYLSGFIYLDGNIMLSNKGTQNVMCGLKAGKSVSTGQRNTYLGYSAGFNDSSSSGNVFIGNASGYSNNAKSGNVFIGDSSGYFNSLNSGVGLTATGNVYIGNKSGRNNQGGFENVAVGASSLSMGAQGVWNVAVGAFAMENNDFGANNVSIGNYAMRNNISSSANVAIGSSAFTDHLTGNNNVAIGMFAMKNHFAGENNVAIGSESFFFGTGGDNNVALGYKTLRQNSSGNGNCAIGNNAMLSNTSGIENSVVGNLSLSANTTGSNNTLMGNLSGSANTTGSYNTAIGSNTLLSNSIGSYNIGIGYGTQQFNSYGNYNVAVGDISGALFANLSNTLALGSQTYITASNAARIGNTSMQTIGGQVGWTTLSDGNFKVNVKENVPGMEFINALRPVTYNINVKALNRKFNTPDSIIDKEAVSAKEKIFYTGFIAQEVEKAARKINFDFSGVDAPKNENDIYGLRYAEFVVPIVKALQEVDEKNHELMKEIENLKAVLYSENRLTKSETSDWIQQNVPNPFTSTTAIKYSVNENCKSAFIKIYSTNGMEVASKPITQKGTSEIIIEAGTLFPGIYSYSLFVDGKSIDTKLMILTK